MNVSRMDIVQNIVYMHGSLAGAVNTLNSMDGLARNKMVYF